METIFFLEVKYFSQFHPTYTFKRNMGFRNSNGLWQIVFFETSEPIKKKEKKNQTQRGPKHCICFVLASDFPLRFICVVETFESTWKRQTPAPDESFIVVLILPFNYLNQDLLSHH